MIRRLQIWLFIGVNLFGATLYGTVALPAGGGPDVAFFRHGVAMMNMKRWSAAERFFLRALSKNEGRAETHTNLGYVLRKQGRERHAEAEKHYDRALALDPDLAAAHEYLGVLYVITGRTAKAQEALAVLTKLQSPLAADLRWVIDHGREPSPAEPGEGGGEAWW